MQSTLHTFHQYGQEYPRIVIDISAIYGVFRNWQIYQANTAIALTDENIFDMIEQLFVLSDATTHNYVRAISNGPDLDRTLQSYKSTMTPEVLAGITEMYLHAGVMLRDILYYYGLIRSEESTLDPSGFTETLVYVLEHISTSAAVLVRLGYN